MRHYFINIAAPDDAKGAARRMFMVFNDIGTNVRIIEDSYDSHCQLESLYPGAVMLTKLNVTVGEYKAIVKGGR